MSGTNSKAMAGISSYFAQNKRAIVVVGGALGVVVAGWVMTNHNRESAPPSQIQFDHNGSDVAGSNPSQEYQNEQTQFARQQAQQAMASGRSYVAPLSIDNTQAQKNNFGLQTPATSSPPATVKAAPPESVQLARGNGSVQDQAVQQQQAIEQAYVAQVRALIQAQASFPAPSTIQVDAPDAPDPGAASSQAPTNAAQKAAGKAAASGSQTPTIAALGLAPGDTLYVDFQVGADSDVPGPVEAKVVDGPLNGAELLGNFTRQKTELVVQFSTLSFQNQTYSMTSYAIDPNKSLPELRSSVNNHYLADFGDLLAGAFLGAASGYGQAVAQSGEESIQTAGLTSTITTPVLTPTQEAAVAGAQAAGTVAQVVGNGLMQNYNRPPTVRIAAGTTAGVLIMSVQSPATLPNAPAGTVPSSAAPGQQGTQSSGLLPTPMQIGRYNALGTVQNNSLAY
jgi:intracellular multiplication protein IcmE